MIFIFCVFCVFFHFVFYMERIKYLEFLFLSRERSNYFFLLRSFDSFCSLYLEDEREDLLDFFFFFFDSGDALYLFLSSTIKGSLLCLNFLLFSYFLSLVFLGLEDREIDIFFCWGRTGLFLPSASSSEGII